MVPVGDGVELEVRRIQHEESKGPVLVFLHESLGSIALWRKFPEKLAKATGCDALIYNRQGYGHSSDEELPRPYDYLEVAGHRWLPGLLDKLEIQDIVLVGHSDGGSIALVTAGTMGDRVKALVTMAAHIYADHLTLAGIEEMAVRYRETDIRERLARYHGDRTDIECPAMIIQGENDEYGVPEQVADIVAGIGEGAHGVILEDAGHSPHLEKQDQVVDLLYDFLRSESVLKNCN